MDAKNLAASGLKPKAQEPLAVLAKEKTVRVLRIWTQSPLVESCRSKRPSGT